MFQTDYRKTLTIVATGPFAPATFHPWWFAYFKLLGEGEIQSIADNPSSIVTPEATIFKVAGFDIDVRTNRIQIGTSQENLFEPVRDLICGTLDVLEGTFIEEIGINWTLHYATPSEAAWHAAGDKLCPKTLWGEVWPKHAGMLNLQVELERNDDFQGKVNIQFQPSKVLKHGVFSSINDHYQIKRGDEHVSAADAASFIRKQWGNSKEIADRLFGDIYERTK
ncbi:MAG: hypothetical protein K5880_11705 [Hydrogenophaga sp.]|uniref:hypothetical protein n=1 Tax=Hydrogenophaga sp. TaxID=1904254 RepID=UPI0026290F4E|nr:hypothetical protein [Hydrogenophaga sp.]MCV0439291.1 hypothetical protein [Hydrogenophaga sp.]